MGEFIFPPCGRRADVQGLPRLYYKYYFFIANNNFNNHKLFAWSEKKSKQISLALSNVDSIHGTFDCWPPVQNIRHFFLNGQQPLLYTHLLKYAVKLGHLSAIYRSRCLMGFLRATMRLGIPCSL
jgi:hypothetical protein